MVLITLLTDVWQLKLLQAASITNIQDGAKGIITIFIAFLANDYLGDSITLLFSAILYSGGLAMMFYTYPSITNEEKKACRERNICKEKPIGIMVYLALVLITVGQCGHKNYMEYLKWEDEIEKLGKLDQPRILTRQYGFTRRILNRIHIFNLLKKGWCLFKRRGSELIGGLIAILLPHLIASDHNQFLIRAYMLGVSSCLLIAGKLPFYPFEGPRGSPMLKVFQIINVAFKKRHFDITETSCTCLGDEVNVDDHDNQYTKCEPQNNNSKDDDDNCSKHLDTDFENGMDGTEAHSSNQNSETTTDLTNTLRFLNRAALYYPSTEDPQSEVENGRLRTVKEAEDAKCFIRAGLQSLTFLTYGLIQGVSKTFFVEQANNMDRHIWSVNVPVQIFNFISSFTEIAIISVCQKCKRTKPHRRFHGTIRIGLGMFASCFCFIAAFLVEEKRLKALKMQRTLTAFWLLPQLILMGAMDGLAKSGIASFFRKEMPKSVSIAYGTILADTVTGVGKLLSIVLIVGVENGTKRHDHPSWFGNRVNDSRLDKFYIIMIGFGFISSFIFAMVALLERHHRHKSSTSH